MRGGRGVSPVSLSTLGILVNDRLAELRARAARYNLGPGVAPSRLWLRVALGHALIRMGQRLLGGFGAVRATA